MKLTTHSWREALEVIQKLLQEGNERLRPGASDELIAELKQRTAKADLFVPDEYVEFLKFTNEFGWNGFDIYGYDPADEYVTLNDFFAVNESVGYRFPDTIYGNDNGDHFIRSASDGKFRLVDGGSDIQFGVDDSFFGLFLQILRRKLDAIEN